MTDEQNITAFCLAQHAKDFAQKPALILVDRIGSERQFSYAELNQAVIQVAAGLKNFNLPKSAPIALRCADTYDLVLAFLAGMAAGLAPIPIIYNLPSDRIEFILHDAACRLMLDLGDTHALQLPSHCKRLQADEWQNLKKFSGHELATTTQWHDPAFIFYTSGSSGKPKGVLHAHRAILGRKPSLAYWLDITSADRVMHTDNLCWTYSMFSGFLDPLAVGATAVLYAGSQLTTRSELPITHWLQMIEHYQITLMASSPDIYNAIIHCPKLSHYPLRSLRAVGSAGAMLPETVQEHWQQHFNMPIYIALGMSELSTFISTGHLIPPRAGTLGKIQPGRKVAILPLDEGFTPVPPNTEGMLAINSKEEPGFMLGYIGEAKTQDQQYRGDWFLTQDIVSADQDGYITYHGRADDVLKLEGGFRVAPVQVENLLLTCEGVLDAACGPEFDEQSQTDFLVAYLVSDNANDALIAKIRSFLTEHLADYKIPRKFYFVEHLPRNARGKLVRAELKSLVHNRKREK